MIGISKHESQDTLLNKQTALYALKLLIRVLSTNHASELNMIVPVITEVHASEGANQHVAASALLCLAELCSRLNVRIISHLPNFMPSVLSVFEDVETK